MEIKTIGIVGYGAFGSHIHELLKRFVPNIIVKVRSDRFEPDGQTFFSDEEVCKCDVVVLACSIADYESRLQCLLPLIPKTTIIVDVATVKKHTSELFKRLASDRQYLCTHPMFGPESYKKTDGNIKGFRVVITDRTIPEDQYNNLKNLLTNFGFIVIEMSADKHDELLAETLFITHYVGQTMKLAGFVRTPLDSVSFGSLMNAVESVAHDEKLFRDVYLYNPHCKEIAERFHLAQEEIFNNLSR